MIREPKDLLIRAQVYLLWQRRRLRIADQVEWDVLTDAVFELEKCLKLLEGK